MVDPKQVASRTGEMPRITEEKSDKRESIEPDVLARFENLDTAIGSDSGVLPLVRESRDESAERDPDTPL